MKEIWKDVKDFEGLYQISNIGNVRSIGWYNYDLRSKTKKYISKIRNLKTIEDRGYIKLHLSRNGKRTTKYIHQLVAVTFIPNPNKYREVNHIDSNPSNNLISNLEWCDRQYNIDHKVKRQNDIKERNEMRMEALEELYYMALTKKTIKNTEILERIDKNLIQFY